MSAPMITAKSLLEAARNLRNANDALNEIAEDLRFEKARPLRDLALKCEWSAIALESALRQTRVEVIGSVDEVAA